MKNGHMTGRRQLCLPEYSYTYTYRSQRQWTLPLYPELCAPATFYGVNANVPGPKFRCRRRLLVLLTLVDPTTTERRLSPCGSLTDTQIQIPRYMGTVGKKHNVQLEKVNSVAHGTCWVEVFCPPYRPLSRTPVSGPPSIFIIIIIVIMIFTIRHSALSTIGTKRCQSGGLWGSRWPNEADKTLERTVGRKFLNPQSYGI